VNKKQKRKRKDNEEEIFKKLEDAEEKVEQFKKEYEKSKKSYYESKNTLKNADEKDSLYDIYVHNVKTDLLNA
ncbi:MAG: hypothetical protein LBF97_03115, partial [Elusimicrobiota bacterium]|nr:hypothetical protein [Elusimicrobiota bacterium]